MFLFRFLLRVGKTKFTNNRPPKAWRAEGGQGLVMPGGDLVLGERERGQGPLTSITSVLSLALSSSLSFPLASTSTSTSVFFWVLGQVFELSCGAKLRHMLAMERRT